jgi:N-acetylmuramoyl-L-alanine amidase
MKREVDLIVIHCSATKENTDYTREELERDHRARGFAKGGYHRYITKDGAVHKLREFFEVGAHVAGHNSRSIGICYEGGLDERGKPKDTRTEAQMEALIKTITEAVSYGNGKVKRIVGHRDLSPDTNGNGIVEPHEWVKLCPCFEAEPEYKYLLKKERKTIL